MKKSDNPSLHQTLAFAATLAALGASVGVPVEHALAAQLPVVHDDPVLRTPPLEVAFVLVEDQERKQGMGDGSVKPTTSSAGKIGATQEKDRKQTGAKQGKEKASATQIKLHTAAPAALVPAVQK